MNVTDSILLAGSAAAVAGTDDRDVEIGGQPPIDLQGPDGSAPRTRDGGDPRKPGAGPAYRRVATSEEPYRYSARSAGTPNPSTAAAAHTGG